SNLPFHAHAQWLRLHALKLDAVVELVNLDAVEHAEEIEVPPRPAILAIGGKLKPDVFLFLDQLLDLFVLDRIQLRVVDGPHLMTRARILDRLRPKKASDMVGTKRRGCSLHRRSP